MGLQKRSGHGMEHRLLEQQRSMPIKAGNQRMKVLGKFDIAFPANSQNHLVMGAESIRKNGTIVAEKKFCFF